MRIDASDETQGALQSSLKVLKAALAASGVVGIWNWDHENQTVRFDHGAAKLITGRSDLEGQDIAGTDPVVQMCIHPDDKDWLNSEMIRAIQNGSIILTEYRVRSAEGEIRWLLSRGRVFRTEGGTLLRSSGILIDVTEHHEGGDASYLVVPRFSEPGTLADAAEHCLQAHEGIKVSGSPLLRTLMEGLLLTLGKELARSAANRDQRDN